MAALSLDILIANTPGKSITLPYTNDEPLSLLLDRISSHLGENPSLLHSRELYINGLRLSKGHNDHQQQESLSTHRILGNTLTYRSRPRQDLMVFIKTLYNKSFTFVCQPHHTLDDLKEMMYRADGLLPEMQARYVFNCKILVEKKTLQEQGVIDGSTLRFVSRLRGGGSVPGVLFADVSDTNNIKKVNFSNEAPPGRVAVPGTNIECRCACTPSYLVISRFGFGITEVSKGQYLCPRCYKADRTVPVTVGFTECKYRLHGLKSSSGEQFTSEWTTVLDEDCYQRLDPGNQTSWSRLVIESMALEGEEGCVICLEELLGGPEEVQEEVGIDCIRSV
ncbi:hypothetical protein BGX33_012335 [Mortierella sp. NVP41]|nr:hypothetical protein BGX33_012335 [Mortierella sp. NVP41]